MSIQITITNGPFRAALQAAPEQITFDTLDGSVRTRIQGCRDLHPAASEVIIRGEIMSGVYAGSRFFGSYDPATHEGQLTLAVP